MTSACPHCHGAGHQSPDPGGTSAAYYCPDCDGRGIVDERDDSAPSWLWLMLLMEDDPPVMGQQGA